jgi:hypothetical protein
LKSQATRNLGHGYVFFFFFFFFGPLATQHTAVYRVKRLGRLRWAPHHPPRRPESEIKFFFLLGSVIPFPTVFLLQAGSNTKMNTRRNHHHHFTTLSPEQLNLSLFCLPSPTLRTART